MTLLNNRTGHRNEELYAEITEQQEVYSLNQAGFAAKGDLSSNKDPLVKNVQ